MRRALLAASFTLALAALLSACPKPAPTPCRVDGAKAAKAPSWGTAWNETMLDEPPNGWIGSFVISPDGKYAAYANSLAGEFIPTSDGVTLVRILTVPEGKDRHPTVIELPGEALRNYAAIAWSEPGIVWAHWSAFGTATPDGSVRVLDRIPKQGKDRPTFPLYSSVGWAPGGDCVAVILDKADLTRELQAWKAKGASGPSHVQRVQDRESIAGWGADGILLLKTPPIVSSTSTAVAPSSAQWMDPVTGARKDAPAPSPKSEAFGWGPGWISVGSDGVLRDANGTALYTLKATLEPNVKLKEHHRWLRVFPSPSGDAVAVEEAIIGPGRNRRALHLLTKKTGG